MNPKPKEIGAMHNDKYNIMATNNRQHTFQRQQRLKTENGDKNGYLNDFCHFEWTK